MKTGVGSSPEQVSQPIQPSSPSYDTQGYVRRRNSKLVSDSERLGDRNGSRRGECKRQMMDRYKLQLATKQCLQSKDRATSKFL